MNPVALTIDRQVTHRLGIFNLDNTAKAQDFKFALSGYNHLDPIGTYDMLTGPREFDLLKEAWREQVSKAMSSVHPSSTKVKCLLEMKKCLSMTTWHWVQNYQTSKGTVMNWMPSSRHFNIMLTRWQMLPSCC